jgi:hypothetical protein
MLQIDKYRLDCSYNTLKMTTHERVESAILKLLQTKLIRRTGPTLIQSLLQWSIIGRALSLIFFFSFENKTVSLMVTTVTLT